MVFDLKKSMPDVGLGCANVMKATLPELIETAARHGFRRITARPYAFAQALEAGHTEKSLRRLLSDAGIRVTMIDGMNQGLPGVPSTSTIDPKLRGVYPPDVFDPPDEETCFRTVEGLEAGVLNLIHFRGKPMPLQELADAVGQVCERAHKRGITIALEFVANTGIPSLNFAQAIRETCGAPNCAIVFDFSHHDRSGGTLEDVRRLPKGAIANIQICDRTPPPTGQSDGPMSGRQMPGEGKLPTRELMAAALENNPYASADIEVLNEELRALSTDEITARMAAATKKWIASF